MSAPVPSVNLDAEREVLGAMLITELALTRAIDDVGLEPGDFYRDKHRLIFTVARDLYTDSKPVDVLTAIEELARRDKIKEAGGKHYVSELAAIVGAPGNAKHYAEIVWRHAREREKREIAQALGNGLAPEEAIEQLRELLDSEPGSDGASATSFSQVRREVVKWLWPDRMPLGMLTLLIGDPGLGKSLLTVMLAAKVSRAGGGVLILSAEDHKAATIRPRLEAVQAELERVHHVEIRRDGVEDGLALPDDAAELDRLVAETGARLVVVDPLMAHLPESVNSWRDQSVRRALAPLYRIAELRGCAVVVVAHLNKATGADPLHRAGGSIAIPAAVRSALLLARDPQDPEGERGSQRVLAHVKCNVGPQAESLACLIEPVMLEGDERLEAPRLRITGTSETSGSDLLSVLQGEERTERDEAMDFLRAELAEGPRPAKDVRRQARDAGIRDRTLDRAKAGVGVESKREGFGPGSRVLWALPDTERHAHISDLALYEENGSTEPNPETADSIERHGSDMASNGGEE